MTFCGVFDKIFVLNKKGVVMEYKKQFKVSEIFPGLKPGPNTHKEILQMVNERRPYCLNDFKRQYFIPNLREDQR